jgi:RNA polymerase sigma factor for flagellar operon FliA
MKSARPFAPARRAPSTPVGHVPTTAEIQTYLPLVRSVVSGVLRRLPPTVRRDDLMAAGTFGLLDALRKHGGEVGSTFEWYARTRIRGAIFDELRAQDWLPRRERSKVTASAKSEDGALCMAIVRFNDLPDDGAARLTDRNSPSPLDLAQQSAERAAVRDAIASLPERERLIVTLHDLHNVQLKVIAAKLGVSEPRISQLRGRAMGMLRVILESNDRSCAAD